jgi:hypothetical protein
MSTPSPREIAVGVIIIGALPSISTFFVYAIASVLVFLAVFFPFADPAGHAVVVCGFRPAFFGRPIARWCSWFEKRYAARRQLTAALFPVGVYAGIAFLPTFASLACGGHRFAVGAFSQGGPLRFWTDCRPLLAMTV